MPSGEVETPEFKGGVFDALKPFIGLRGGSDRTRLPSWNPLVGLIGRGFLEITAFCEKVSRKLPELTIVSEGDDSLTSFPSSPARGDDVSNREVRSETVFRSRYETNTGGSSSGSVLDVLDVFAEELETVVGDLRDGDWRESPFLPLSANLKNLSAGTLAPSRSDGLSPSEVYPA
jgi:hypothetical protein